MLNKFRETIIKLIDYLKNKLKRDNTERRWIDLMALLASTVTLATYCSISPILAEYQGKKAIYWATIMAIVLMLVIAGWEFICLIGYNFWKHLFENLRIAEKKVLAHLRKSFFSPQTLFVVLTIGIITIGVMGFLFQIHTRKCYTSIVEVYGIPVGVGEELSVEEQNRCANYWIIEDYIFRKHIVLSYKDLYHQSEIMRQYSSLYNMNFFQPSDHMVYKYKKNKNRFLSLKDEQAYIAASNNKFREPVEISYFDGNDKLLLNLEKKDKDDVFRILYYSSDSMPQLLNSTLLKIPTDMESLLKEDKNEQISKNAVENSILLQQIEVTYNADGLLETRRVNPRVYNLYGVNGERYVYNEDKQLTTLYYLDISGNPVCNQLGIMRVSFEYGDDNRLACIRYYSDENGMERTEGFHEVFCEKYAYDEDGNLCQRKHLNRGENSWYDINGICEYQYDYDQGVLIRETFLDFSGNKVRHKRLQTTSLGYSLEGNESDNQEITVSFDSIVAPSRQNVSAAGDQKENSDKNEDKESVEVVMSTNIANDENEENKAKRENQEGNGTKFAKEEWFNIEKDKTATPSDTEEQSEDTANAAASRIGATEEENTSRAYTSVSYFFDAGKGISETSYFSDSDKDGTGTGNSDEKTPVLNENGFSRKLENYDSSLRVTTKSYFDENNDPVLIDGGYSQVNIKYAADNGDAKECIEYRDLDNNLTLNKKTEYNYAYIEYKPCDESENHNQADYTIQLEYYDQNKDPLCLPGKGYSKIKQTYNESGYLIREAYYKDENGKESTAYRMDYMAAAISYEYADDGNQICIEYMDAFGNPINRSDTGYAVVYQEFEGGHRVKVYYKGYEDGILRAVADKKTGMASASYVYLNGKEKEAHYFDAKGDPVLRSDLGYTALKNEYDNRGALISEAFYGTDGKLIIGKDMGCAVVKYEYDKFGRRILYHFYDTEQNPFISTQYYCAGMQYQYDDSGNRTDIRYLDENDNPMFRSDLGYARLHRVYNKDGNIVEENYYDTNDAPIECKEGGYATYKAVYDSKNLIRTEYNDRYGKLILRKDTGYATAVFLYNEIGKCTWERYFDTNIQPVISTKYHCAGFWYEYNDENQKTTHYLDLSGKIMVRSDLGYATFRQQYDDFGNLIEESYFDADDKPVLCKEGGYASYENKLNEDGYCVRSIYRNENGDAVLRKDTGYAVAEYKYDDFGNYIWISYYGTGYNTDYDIDDAHNHKARITSAEYGCAGLRYSYDASGNRTDVTYVDTEGNIMVRRDLGYARTHREYDPFGNLICESYFDAEDKPTICNTGGYSVCKQVYENGNCIECRYYDTNDNLVLRKDEGYAVRKCRFNKLGQFISDSYYDIYGKPVINTKYKSASFEYEYDRRGYKTDSRYKDLNGDLMCRTDLGYAHEKMEYDSRGNVVKRTYYDEEERLTLSVKRGIACYESRYDEHGNWVEGRCYGKNRELKTCKDDGYAVIRNFYDKYGQQRAYFFYDTDGRSPVISDIYHCAGSIIEYNGNETITRYFDINGNLMIRADLGYAEEKVTTEYDSVTSEETRRRYFFDTVGNSAFRKERGYSYYEDTYRFGNWIKGSYYIETLGEGPTPIQRDDANYAIVEQEFDQFGLRVRTSYFDENHNLVIYQSKGRTTCAEYVYEYDEKGNNTEVRYLDDGGNPMLISELGAAQVCMEYDEQGNKIEERYYDVDHNLPEDTERGYASYDCFFDENGNCIETRYYDAEKKLTLRTDENYAVYRDEFDKYGRCILTTYYDTDDNPTINTRYGCSVFEYRYDQWGNMTDIIYKNTDGKLMIREDLGYAWIEREYDEWNRLISERYYDAKKNPTTDKAGCAEIKYDYEESIDNLKSTYYNLNGEEINFN